MCGIFGAMLLKDFNQSNSKTVTERINQLAILNSSRGTQSTGLARISTDEQTLLGHVLMHKDAVSSNVIVNHKCWKQTATITKHTTAFLGHTRFATHGAITAKNAHPFIMGDTVGIHNGVIHDILPDFKNCVVDSEAAIQMIDEKGLEKISDYIGSAAIAFMNLKKADKLHLFRDSNPMHVYINFMDRYALFSSEDGHLCKAINALNTRDHEIIFELPENSYITLDTNGKFEIIKEQIFLGYAVKSWKSYGNICGPVTHGYYEDYDEWCGYGGYHQNDQEFGEPKDEGIPWDKHKTEFDTSSSKVLPLGEEKDTELFEEQITLEELSQLCGVSTSAVMYNADVFLNTDEMTELELKGWGRGCDICKKTTNNPNQIYHVVDLYGLKICEDCIADIHDVLYSQFENFTDQDESSILIEDIPESDIIEFSEHINKKDEIDIENLTKKDTTCSMCGTQIEITWDGIYTKALYIMIIREYGIPLCFDCCTAEQRLHSKTKESFDTSQTTE